MRTCLSISLAAAISCALVAAPAPAPTFAVDPLWPKPLPNHWLLGSVTGVAVDAQDHVWVVHRGYDSFTARTEIGLATDPKTAEDCCLPAPFVLEFDPAGALVNHWGGPGTGYDWPVSPGGIAIDGKGNVWITAAGPPQIPGTGSATPQRPEGVQGRAANPAPAGRGGRGAANAPPKPQDAHVLKFSKAGSFLLQIGKAGNVGTNDSKDALNRPAGIAVDDAANEVYVADGFGNTRIVVFDATTGAYKRQWNGAGPDSPFAGVTCVKLAKDGTVYVCDRGNNRVAVFDKTGKFIKQAVVSPKTKGTGSVWDVALSRDPQQQFLYVADGHDQKVFILRRDTLEIAGDFGDGGRYPGTFYSVGSVAVDSKGNIYTGENLEGKRVQKFVLKGGGR
jgi:DNA-binding beta-propeller fold protein YncE